MFSGCARDYLSLKQRTHWKGCRHPINWELMEKLEAFRAQVSILSETLKTCFVTAALCELANLLQGVLNEWKIKVYIPDASPQWPWGLAGAGTGRLPSAPTFALHSSLP